MATMKNDIKVKVDVDCEAIDTLRDSLDNAGKAAKKAAMELEALREILHVDEKELKEKVIIKTLNDMLSTGDIEVDSDLICDILGLIDRLIQERDEARKVCHRKERELVNTRAENAKNISRLNIIYKRLKNATYGSLLYVTIPVQKKYTREDVTRIVNEQASKYYKCLTELSDEVLK